MRKVLSLLGVGALGLALVAIPGDAATPASGSVGPAAPTASWQGQVYAAAANPGACPSAAQDPLNLVCDHYTLTVGVDQTYWTANTGGVKIAITWPDAANDFDLQIYDAAGNQVASSGGSSNLEQVFLPNAAGSYEVRVVPFLVTGSGYSGTATFQSVAGGPATNPPRDSGGLAFAPPTVVDTQRTEGEPIVTFDRAGNEWESGPWGTATQQSFIHKSTDGGDQFNVVSMPGLRPDLPPGGGDTDVATDDQNYAYFSDLEGLVKIEAAVSNDGGNTWRQNKAVEATTADDRQWLAVDDGTTTAAVDNTVFLTYRQTPLGSFVLSSPGSTGPADPVGGVVYQNAADTPDAISTGAPCGQMKFDPVKRNLYLPCGQGDHVLLAYAHVAPGQRTGLHFQTSQTPKSPGGGNVGNVFPTMGIDKAGNVYVAWVDENSNDVYYAASTDGGATWSPAQQVNGGDANTNEFVWVAGGGSGTAVIAWLGSPEHMTSDNMPSWYNDRQAASRYPWYGYVSVITNATSPTPTFAQQKFWQKPTHYGQICNSGTLCLATGGDRTMADYFSVALDPQGAIRVVFNDTTSQHHGAHLFEARQIAGPNALTGATLAGTAPTSPVSDATGDAQVPHFAPLAGPGPNQRNLDLTKVSVTQPDAATLRFQMEVADLSSLAPPPGKTSSFWITRFLAKSIGDGGETSYRIFYAGAQSDAGGAPTFFAGSGTSNQGDVPGNGCTNTTTENCKVVQYPAEVPATGSISGNTITIDVPLQGGFGPNRPINDDRLWSVTAFTGGRNGSAPDVHAEADASRAFDYLLGAPTTTTTAKHLVTGGGSSTTPSGGTSRIALDVRSGPTGKVAWVEPGIDFRSTRITSADFKGSTVTVSGEGVRDGAAVTFTLTATDNGASADSYSISLSDGSSRQATLAKGNIRVV